MSTTMTAVVHVAASLVTGAAATLAWRERHATPAAGALTLALGGVVTWCAGDLVRLVADPALCDVAALAIYGGIAAAVTGFLCLALASTDPSWSPRRPVVVLLALEPAVLLPLVATNRWHHLVYLAAGPGGSAGPAGSWIPGPVHRLQLTYSYLLMAAGFVVLLRGWLFAVRFHRRQLSELLLATSAPVLVTLAGLAGLPGGSAAALLPLAFSASGVGSAHAILRRGLLRVVPVARELVLDEIDDAIVVLDADGRIADLNPAAGRMLRRCRPELPADLVGLTCETAAGVDVAALGTLAGVHTVWTPSGPLEVDIRLTPLTPRRASGGGWAVVVRDITELSRRGRELADANTVLREQVRTIEQLRAELAEQAVRDPLTGLHNRRHLDARMATLLAAARRDQRPVGIAVVDIDRFKQVNDLHGHPVGDALLVAVARQIQTAALGLACCAALDSVTARHGGEEFVLVLPGCDLAATAEVAELIRQGCAELAVPGRDGARVSCTVSGGVAAFPVSGADAPAVLQAADDALYAAKAAGRNRVVTQAQAAGRVSTFPAPAGP